MTRRLVAGLGLLVLVGCRGEPRDATGERTLARLVDSLAPEVERAVGLRFRQPPRYAMRSREQVRAFVQAKLAEQLPPETFRRITRAYALLGLLPDSLDVRLVMEQLLAQQIAGYYDPDSATFYGVLGSDPSTQRLTIAHELVHALQDQYLPLDSILRDRSDNDRSLAAQAILEGQANYASIAMLQGAEVAALPEFWEQFRATGDEVMAGGDFARVPAVIREGLLFPYIGGAEFIRWWLQSPLRDTLPYGPRLPASSEQILFPERYAAGDAPLDVRFTDAEAGAYEDVLGEFEVRLLQQELTGQRATTSVVPLGWGGDRYRLAGEPGREHLVWVSVWDAPTARDRFVATTGARLLARARDGYRSAADTLTVSGRPGWRFVTAPEGWEGWGQLPAAEVRGRPATRAP
ncbi:MAG: hypothetical protein MUC69_05295 [Gemmatimonadales bacterium]|jgi:hypothetical protein|nr:hypothetical protein [Gemmatimonadales bacterium]